ncbi:ABC transporter permease [Roseivirga sp. E12]|uniref:ABC transporter permease n=1 Tax=Roseivirga sp. E12 TaxID=2819237 RepID=UPI001ABC3E29|nr:ABC transporter permease [Roseivirga sp. E12]MBO3697224.1 ABC transporter permease [Roseivirga sp. E12]
MSNPHYHPPKWLDKLIEMLCPSDLHEEVLGDLHERYHYMAVKKGSKPANLRYALEVMIYLKSTALSRSKSKHSKTHFAIMIKHYFITATRNIVRNKAFSFINVMGLVLGISAFLLINLWVDDEKSVDNFHEHQKDLYALYLTSEINGEVFGDYDIKEWELFSNRDVWLAEELPKVIPEIKHIATYITGYELPWGYPNTFQIGDVKHRLEGAITGNDFFKMFSYPILYGDKENPLTNAKTLVISEYMASIFFENPQDAVGKTIRYENTLDMKITGVFKNTQANSSLQFDYLISWEDAERLPIVMSDNKAPTFIQLHENADPKLVEQKLRAFDDSRNNPAYENLELGLQPYGDQYLVSKFENGKPTTGRIEYVRIFSGVAIFVLIIACINFTNLATSRSLKRAKEVGVRKVIGSSKKYLIWQFLGESVMLTTIAMIISLVLVSVALPAFNNFTGKEMLLPIGDLTYGLYLIGIIVLTGFLSGAYPAIFLSSLQPAKVLKGLARFTKSAKFFRKGLAIFQFSLSILLLIATLVVSRQTDYIQNTNLGYEKENVIYVRVEGDLVSKYHLFKERLSTKPGIAMVDRSSEAPHDMAFEIAGPFAWEGMEEGRQMSFKPTSVGFDFLEMMGLEIVDGRGFDKTIPTDTAAFMINETALRLMNLDEPLGKRISAWSKQGRIIGVLKDYHTHSLHEPIKPLIVDVKEDLNFGIIMVKTLPGQTETALKSLEEVSSIINPNYPLDYQFMDLEYAELYKNEKVVSSLSNIFAILAIMISCLGLLGLAMFSTEQRIKEIGIRKVLGASISSIIRLFSKDFLQLVALSFIIAAPIAAYLMKDWLQGFAYKISLSWWIFALTGIMALGIAFLTVAYQTFTAAKSNPIKNLRTE